MATAALKKAKFTRELFSNEPSGPKKACMAELGEFMVRHLRALRNEASEQEQLERLQDGRKETLRGVLIPVLCEVLGVDLDLEKQARLASMSSKQLHLLHTELCRIGVWPEGV
jgi:hypothetical protein